MRLIFLALIVVLAGCGVCFYFGAVKWDPEVQPEPQPQAQYWWQYLLIGIGAAIAILSIIGFTVFSWIETKRFYLSQMAYWQTEEFKKAKADALSVDLALLKKKDLKWYKKMGYVTSMEKNAAIDKQKSLKKEYITQNKKWSYAKPKLEQLHVIKK